MSESSTKTARPRGMASSNGWLILTALALGIAAGVGASSLGDGWRDPAIRWASAIGGIWLDALKVTVIPLIVALLISGIVGGAKAAAGSRVAGRSIIWFVIVLTASATFGGLAMPLLLGIFPLPEQAAEALRAGLARVDKAAAASSVPTALDFVRSIIPSNIFAAAVNDQILPLTLFTAAFAVAITKIDPPRRANLVDFFQAVEQAMLVMIGWVLWIAPVGVFGLAFALGAGAGASAFGAVIHYVLLVMLVGLGVTAAGYVIAMVFAGWSLRSFARSMIPPQAVAISTQSSLASLPAMVGAARNLGVREENSDVTLPLAVALFRATGPAMNVAVAVYLAYWLGIELAPWQLFAGIAMASIASYWAVSLPGQLSFVTSIAPIALAMGLPVEPLAILIAVETFPDIVRTLGNVTMDVAVTGAVARKTPSAD
jgi:proton glutamate symport protein